uniref:Uncharacterized protein n=1 Tax=Rhizophora mucronata TaxID=61149 RepID=A0A2P2J328_RHIMU
MIPISNCWKEDQNANSMSSTLLCCHLKMK